ncbi:hypothetical protein TKK_0002355 [Trichogramma kaykai]|uniref:28S ribosomal protein S30, mitochondrial n=1 Tax=Trichogramma kaykai TaxID=54128 RepID=A0ABD2XBR0_9HYME
MQCCKAKARLAIRLTPSVRFVGVDVQFKNVPSSYKYTGYYKKARLIDPESEPSFIPLKCYNPPQIDENGCLTLPVMEYTREARKRRARELWHEKVRKLDTVEEKIFELSMPRYYGWKTYQLGEELVMYDALPKTQYMTQTHIASEPGLPSHYDQILDAETIDATVRDIKDQVEESLVFEYNYRKQDYQFSLKELEDKTLQENIRTKAISEQINRILMSSLSMKYPHLMESQIDIDPRIEAFWFFGGFEVPPLIKKARKSKENSKEWADEPVNQQLQYKGKPILQVRHQLPLREIMSMEATKDTSWEIPVEDLDPRTVGYKKLYEHASIIPGFWPGDPNEFGLVSYHNMGYLHKRHETYEDREDAIKSQAILANFAWLYGQACYQGFSTFHNPTYPLVNQAVITNGQEWNFSVYQLNTTTMHIDAINENETRNMCWVTEPIKLFECIEDDKVKGFNDEVLKNLIKFYANVPQVREGVDMKPHLVKEKLVANIEDPERRKWLDERYKHLLSNRPRHRLVPEIYDWQRIYMIDNKTRPLDKRRDWWQFKKHVFRRRLDDHTPPYIPKKQREDPKSRKKWAKMYYPYVHPKEMVDPHNIKEIERPVQGEPEIVPPWPKHN